MTSLLSIRFFNLCFPLRLGLLSFFLRSELKIWHAQLCVPTHTPMRGVKESRTWNIMLDSAYVIQHCRRLYCASYNTENGERSLFSFFFWRQVACRVFNHLKRQASKCVSLSLSFAGSLRVLYHVDFVNCDFPSKKPLSSGPFSFWAC